MKSNQQVHQPMIQVVYSLCLCERLFSPNTPKRKRHRPTLSPYISLPVFQPVRNFTPSNHSALRILLKAHIQFNPQRKIRFRGKLIHLLYMQPYTTNEILGVKIL